MKKERQASEILSQHTYKLTKEVKGKIEETRHKITSIKISLERDKITIDDLKHEVFQALKNAELASRICERLRNPNSNHFVQGSYQVSTSEYFWKLVSSYESKMQLYKQAIDEIERVIASLMKNTAPHPQG